MPFSCRTAYLTIKHDSPAPVQQLHSSRSFLTKENKCHSLTGMFFSKAHMLRLKNFASIVISGQLTQDPPATADVASLRGGGVPS